MNFNELEIPDLLPPLVDKNERKIRQADAKRYVIGSDPYDSDTIEAVRKGINVFTVHDKRNQSISCKVWTTKSFDDFVEWFTKDSASKLPFIVSRKFITANGRTCNIGEANPGSIPSQRYNDTF